MKAAGRKVLRLYLKKYRLVGPNALQVLLYLRRFLSPLISGLPHWNASTS